MKLNKIFDEGAKTPKQALTAEQMPLEVEDPITGKKKKLGEKVEDAADDSSKVALYRQLQRFVPRMLKSMYPSYLEEGNTSDDAVGQIYEWATTPTTSKEDADKLREEDTKNGTTHSGHWYKYEQDVYPKTSKLDWFDSSKSNIEQFGNIIARQGISRLMTKDKSLAKDETGKYQKVAKFSSMDKDSQNGEGEDVNPTRRKAEAVGATESGIDVDRFITRINRMDADHKRTAIEAIKGEMHNENVSPEIRSALREIYNAVKSDRMKYGTGKWTKINQLVAGSAEDYPFGIAPRKVEAADHSARLKFTFGSRSEAEEAAKKHESEMDAKGLKLQKVLGNSLMYALK